MYSHGQNQEALISTVVIWFVIWALYLWKRAQRIWESAPYGFKEDGYYDGYDCWVETLEARNTLIDGELVTRRKFLVSKVVEPFIVVTIHSFYWGGGLYLGMRYWVS